MCLNQKKASKCRGILDTSRSLIFYIQTDESACAETVHTDTGAHMQTETHAHADMHSAASNI